MSNDITSAGRQWAGGLGGAVQTRTVVEGGNGCNGEKEGGTEGERELVVCWVFF